MRAIGTRELPSWSCQRFPSREELVGEVIIECCGRRSLLGSELHAVAHPDGFRTPPLVMGHEIIGRRRDTGELVAVNPLVACGSCDRCALGRTNLCRSREIIGIHRPGGYSERVSVLLAMSTTFRSASLPTKRCLSSRSPNTVRAWALTPHSDEDRVAIIGAGPIGLLFLVLAVARATRAIAVVDLSASRQQMAAALGAGRTASSLDGEFDLIVEPWAVPLRDERASITSDPAAQQCGWVCRKPIQQSTVRRSFERSVGSSGRSATPTTSSGRPSTSFRRSAASTW